MFLQLSSQDGGYIPQGSLDPTDLVLNPLPERWITLTLPDNVLVSQHVQVFLYSLEIPSLYACLLLLKVVGDELEASLELQLHLDENIFALESCLDDILAAPVTTTSWQLVSTPITISRCTPRIDPYRTLDCKPCMKSSWPVR
jgi:hypothetical protein